MSVRGIVSDSRIYEKEGVKEEKGWECKRDNGSCRCFIFRDRASNKIYTE